MKRLLTLCTASLALAGFASSAATVVIDDFAGGPHVVNLTSLSPPEINTGSFLHGGAVGGVRDAAVWSASVGSFAAGVAFNAGGYASFAGRGEGGIVWDGVPGITDTDGNERITADELDYGLGLDISDCETGTIELTAFADLPGAVLTVAIASDGLNYNLYDIALSVGTADYSVDLGSPSSALGTLDYADVGAFAIFVDASALANLDVRVSRLEISCPDAGMTLGLFGAGLLGLAALRRRL